MRRAAVIAAAVVIWVIAAFAGVWLSQIEGTCTDAAGNPLTNATLKFSEAHTGRKFSVQTDARGKFIYTAAQPGAYAVTVLRGGKTLMSFPAVSIQWSSRPQQLRLDLARHSVEVKRETRQAESFGGDTSSEELAPVVVGDDPRTIAVREALEQAQRQGAGGDWNAAIVTLRSSAETNGATYDVIWAQLARAYCNANRSEECIAAYGKAIERNGAGAYYNNRAQAWIAVKRWNEADRDLHAAERANPEQRALYEQNLGVMLMEKVQAGNSEDAAEDFRAAVHAFDQVLSERPENAEVYYLRAYCQVRLLGITEKPPAYADIEAGFRKYLELAPQGSHAEEVRAMLASMVSEQK